MFGNKLNKSLTQYFDCYYGTADIYVYFYERGRQILKKNGILTYISSNKYFRAEYGKRLRRYLSNNCQICQIIDFGDAPVFEAISYPSIIILKNAQPHGHGVQVFTWNPGPPLEDFASIVHSNSSILPQIELKTDGWRLESSTVLRLLEKLGHSGKPLKEYVNERIYRGIVTGYNKAFILDSTTRDRLVAEDPSSVEVIRPYIKGQDIKRWHCKNSNEYILFIPWHFPLHKNTNITGASKLAEQQFRKKYPAVYKHLLSFKNQLESRNEEETGKRYEWYALQRCAATYYKEFDNIKIVWGNLAKQPQFTFADAGYYVNAPANIIVSDSRYLLGILNSKVTHYLVLQSAAQRQGGFVEYKPMYISPLVIPEQPENEQISSVVCQIQVITKDEDYLSNSNKQTKVKELERQIDQMVYELYGLTPEEIGVVEGEAK